MARARKMVFLRREWTLMSSTQSKKGICAAIDREYPYLWISSKKPNPGVFKSVRIFFPLISLHGAPSVFLNKL